MSRWVVPLAIAIVALGGALWVGLPTPSPAPAPLPDDGRGIPIGQGARPEHPELTSITWAGDTLIGDAARKKLREHGYPWVLDGVKDLLVADYTVLNLEAPITKLRRKDMPKSERPWSYNLSSKVGPALLGAGVDAVGFSNNHTFDRREQGVLDTLRNATEAGLVIFGAGADAQQASQPLLLDSPHGRIGVVALTYKSFEAEPAGPESPGAVFLYKETIAEGARIAREAGAEHLVGFVHWGVNYEGVKGSQKRQAQAFADAGYELVVGHGPHVQQPVAKVGDALVLYSLGNFVFNTPGRFQKLDKDPYGLVATTFFGPDGLARVELRCILVDNLRVDYQTRACTPEEAAISYSKLGPLVRVEGDVAVIDPVP